MSLSLVQDYSSEEEREKNEPSFSDDDDRGGDEDHERDPLATASDDRCEVGGHHSSGALESEAPVVGSSLLPSPEDLFSEVTGPPEFLKSSATEPLYTRANNSWQASSGQPLPSTYTSGLVPDSGPGIVLETNANSSGLHKQALALENGSRDGKESARLAAGAGVAVFQNIISRPRLYIGAELKPTTDEEKRSRSKIKDKEKNKRMKGQSSHATWKSETEMQLRQQFD